MSLLKNAVIQSVKRMAKYLPDDKADHIDKLWEEEKQGKHRELGRRERWEVLFEWTAKEGMEDEKLYLKRLCWLADEAHHRARHKEEVPDLETLKAELEKEESQYPEIAAMITVQQVSNASILETW